jgi:hypothetical protein
VQNLWSLPGKLFHASGLFYLVMNVCPSEVLGSLLSKWEIFDDPLKGWTKIIQFRLRFHFLKIHMYLNNKLQMIEKSVSRE